MGYLEIGDRIESDHHQVVAWMRRREKRRNGGGRRRRMNRGIWDGEGKETFKIRKSG